PGACAANIAARGRGRAAASGFCRRRVGLGAWHAAGGSTRIWHRFGGNFRIYSYIRALNAGLTLDAGGMGVTGRAHAPPHGHTRRTRGADATPPPQHALAAAAATAAVAVVL